MEGKHQYLGKSLDFKKFPVEINIDVNQFFLMKIDSEYRLLSNICPHQGGKLHYCPNNECFECSIHHWVFNKDDGSSKNVEGWYMDSIPVTEIEGNLFAQMDIREKKKHEVELRNNGNNKPLIKLHSHACLEIVDNSFSLLCDPWIVGPAFLGAWLPYPPPIVEPKEIKPSAIWISHEHSDHFHEPTLKKFDKDTLIYVPDFPNQRMILKLKKIGFKNIFPIPFGKKINISSHFSITIYEPSSLWNDAMVLIEVGSFRILNLNDAGINHRIAKEVGPVDIIATSFSPGASGYPSTWRHITSEKKIEIMDSSRTGMLKMLEQAMYVYEAEYLLPFASHFTLWRPEHDKYIEKMRKNTIKDVVHYFEHKPFKVIDLLPGEYWDIEKNSYKRNNQIQPVEEYIKKQREQINFYEYTPHLTAKLTRKEIERYFLKLNDVPEMIFCEELICHVETLCKENINIDVFFEIKNGQLKILEKSIKNPNLTIYIPENILKYIIENNESWDEATIGYWCEFDRYPDIYHADFWRLLQAPYYRKRALSSNEKYIEEISKNTNIAELIEVYGKLAERVLGRYGLYCTGCQYSIYESIEQGAISHGLTDAKMNRLLMELKRLCY